MKERIRIEDDKFGRILAEMNASLYLLADIRAHVDKALFSNLEIRMHRQPPDRSLLMIDVGATMVPQNDGIQAVIRQYPNGVILTNRYPPKTTRDKPAEPGQQGESYMSMPRKGEDEAGYRENLERFRKLWYEAQPMVLPADEFSFGQEFQRLPGWR